MAGKVENLTKLANDLYTEGYICGIKSDEDQWFQAWALAMVNVCEGADYTDDLVIECYNMIMEKK